MVSSCCVINCKNRRVKTSSIHLRFYRIPKYDKERRAKWLKAIGREGRQQSSSFTRVCSDHFLYGEKSDDKLSPNYVPCIFSHTTSSEKRRLQKLYDDHNKQLAERTKKMNASTIMLSVVEQELVTSWRSLLAEKELDETRYDCDNANEELNLNSEVLYVDGMCVDPRKHFHALDVTLTEEVEELMNYSKKMKVRPKSDKGTQTVLAHDYIKSLEQECSNLRSELVYFQGKYVFKDIKLQTFISADDKIRYLTGLESYSMLKVLNDTIISYQNKTFKLTSFQQLLMTLMKMRLGLSFPFLAILFNIDLAAVVQLFIHMIDLLFNKVVPLLIFWPDNDEMKRVLPPEFTNCENCLYVADCFEVQIEIAEDDISENAFEILETNISGSLQCVRRYFMTIAPQGSIIFISKGRHGEVRYRTIALESGFFENVGAGDTIVMERELDIDDEVDVRGAVIKMSSSVKTRVLSETDEEGSRGLVRIKWVAHLLKQKYQILEGKIPMSWVKGPDQGSCTTLDKIVQVSCALFNMTNKVWTFERFLGPVREEGIFE